MSGTDPADLKAEIEKALPLVLDLIGRLAGADKITLTVNVDIQTAARILEVLKDANIQE